MKVADLKIGTRLAFGFGVVLTAIAVIGAVSIQGLSNSQDRLEKAVNADAVKMQSALEFESATRANSRRIYELAVAADAAERNKVLERMKVNSERGDKAYDRLKALVSAPEGKALLTRIDAARVQVRDSYEKVRKTAETGKAGEALQVIHAETDARISALTGLLWDMAKLQQKMMDKGLVEGSEAYATSRNMTLALIGFAFALGSLLAWLVTRSVTRPVNEAKRLAEAIAGGDLGQSIVAAGRDETGLMVEAMSAMQERLKSFTLAQGAMSKAHDAGDIDHRIAADEFPGAYGEMAKQVNELAASHLAVQGRMAEVIGRYAVGDFSLDMDRLPGQKARITEAMDQVKSNLVAIKDEIGMLANSAAQGNFKVHGDEDKYEHAFREIVVTLNLLMDVSDRGLAEVARVLGAVSKGDLTEKITNDYAGTFGQLKDDSNQTVAQLTEIVGQIREASQAISTASREIAAGNTDLSQRTEEQASSLEETASSMEELTATVKQNAENARQANQLAAGASEVAAKGGAVVNEVVKTMDSITESSKKIADIIGVIDGIAFQTNILALNAAVEAARAGEQGRGFAVVASEVRSLAQRSANAAKEIKGLIGDSVAKVESGSKLVDDAGNTMKEIVTQVKRVTDIMAEITAASQEQSQGIEQVNQAISQMDQVTQQNAALVEEAAAAAESMKDQAGSLAQAVSVFTLERQDRTPALKLAA